MNKLLAIGLEKLNLSAAQLPLFETYAELLKEKNKVMNLTAITDDEGITNLHFLDSAFICANIDTTCKSVIDVGTGAGFPGMIIKILSPTCDVTLLDSLGKRIDWLKEVTKELGLENVHCIHARAEEYALEHRETYDIVTSRAVASLNMLTELCIPLVKKGGLFVAMKSVESDLEIEEAKGAIGQLGGKIAEIVDYTIPNTDISHRLIKIEKIKQTPIQFPRSFSKIKNHALR